MSSRILIIILLLIAFLAGCSSISKQTTSTPVQEVVIADSPPVTVIEQYFPEDEQPIVIDSIHSTDSLLLTEIDSISESERINNLLIESLATPARHVATADSLAVADSIPRSPNALDAPVVYQANDSIVMTAGNWAYLYGEGDVKYQHIQLQSERIEMNMDSSIVYATFALDSVGQEFGYPLFNEGDQQYESKTMRYNFKTKKGFITSVITQQGEGYVTAGQTKKMDDNSLFMVGGKYTTCDHHENPHFYIQMTKAKVRPGKDIVTGPVYLVIEDVPLPLALPFAFFPFTSSYSSGILMPSFGEESIYGYYLKEGGYYFALSDYADLALTGDIYSKGSWRLNAKSIYKKRYKYSGNFNASYQVMQKGDKISDIRTDENGKPLPTDYTQSKDFQLTWSHTQDPKSNPFRTFSASVNFATSSYNQNNQNSYYNSQATQNQKGSTVSISQRFPNSPFSLSATMSVNQRTSDSSIAVTLPNVNITMSRIYPFKRKSGIGKERWYEKISLNYGGQIRNSIQTKEDQLFKSSLIKDWTNSIEHKLQTTATFSLFNYLNISPSINYSENWYTSKMEQTYDPEKNAMAARDTTYGFYRLYQYDASISASTTLYGFFKPLPFLGNKVEMIRHRFEPSVSLSTRPDFGRPKYGYWHSYDYFDNNGIYHEGSYSPYSGNGRSVPSQGKSGSINFDFKNNIEMKIRSDRDSTGFRKVSLIDNLSTGFSYNMVADSMKWSENLPVNLRIKFSKAYTLNLNLNFDTYLYDENGRHIDKLRIANGKGIGRLRSTQTSFAYTFNNETLKKWFGGRDDQTSSSVNESVTNPGIDGTQGGVNEFYQDEERPENQSGNRLLSKKEESGEYDSNGYMTNTVPWSISLNYSMNLGYGTFDKEKREYRYKITHAANFNGSIQPTKNWRITFNGTFDFDTKKISYMTMSITRDLHCFQMNASVVPVGPYKSYMFAVAVNSSLLQDLKYNKSSSRYDGQTW
ncbi:putative LPS assembly protein LptD [Parabacteroides sp. PF5-9]|uniref:putative LPS assembly protein LptD n=1 Tax=Parabacteroides sp. PF5-9 TaxID=1742404 RepID=UPI002474DA9F|nr:putative LPS assembly protein LptD [Parabacteroides sp. PF5-9]MDH6356927.1 hypothetical protein [Parabacteroides sp. PF5-9]